MQGHNVKTLTEFLEDYGPILPVVYVSPADQVFDIEIEEHSYNGFRFLCITRGERIDPHDGYDVTLTR